MQQIQFIQAVQIYHKFFADKFILNFYRVQLLVVFLPELFGFQDIYTNAYARKNSFDRNMFKLSELLLLLEILNDLMNI